MSEKTNLKSNINKININIDNDYILINKSIKYILNFVCIYIFTSLYIYYNNINNNTLILLICTISSIMLYILDLNNSNLYLKKVIYLVPLK